MPKEKTRRKAKPRSKMYGSRTREKQRKNLRSQKNPLDVREHVKKRFAALNRKRKLRPTLKERLRRLELQRDNLRNLIQRRKRMRVEHEIRAVRQQLTDIEANTEAKQFTDRIEPLLRTEQISYHANVKNTEDNALQTQEAMIMQLCQPEKAVPVLIQTDRCTECRRDLVVNAEEAARVCPECGKKSTFWQSVEDYYDFEHKGDRNDARESHHSSNPYDRPPQYRKFISQFSERTVAPPEEVLEVCISELSKVHVMLKTKVKPTPVSQILRENNFQQYCWMALRIAKILNNEPVPVFTEPLIDRLVWRFRQLQPAFMATKSDDRKKIMNFTYWTRQGLIMENMVELANHFDNHKTKTVLIKEDSRLQKSCELLQGQHEGITWNFRRSC